MDIYRHLECIAIKLKTLFDECTRLRDYVHTRKKTALWNDYAKFVTSLSSLLDVKGIDCTFIKKQEKHFDVDMINNDLKFCRRQKSNPQLVTLCQVCQSEVKAFSGI